jgi:methionine-rich copper-binding protein CopC
MNQITKLSRLRVFATLVPVLLAAARVAVAGTLHLLGSTPAANAMIHGRHAEYSIRFDGPVDHLASRMEIMQSDRVIQSLTPLGDSAVDVLFASGEAPPPGRYVLRWQARSIGDGMVTEGSLPFSVAP